MPAGGKKQITNINFHEAMEVEDSSEDADDWKVSKVRHNKAIVKRIIKKKRRICDVTPGSQKHAEEVEDTHFEANTNFGASNPTLENDVNCMKSPHAQIDDPPTTTLAEERRIRLDSEATEEFFELISESDADSSGDDIPQVVFLGDEEEETMWRFILSFFVL